MTRVLVLNTGSSSLKWTVLDENQTVLGGGNDSWSAGDPVERAAQMQRVLSSAPEFEAVGHRVVHGGPRFRASVRVDAAVRRELDVALELDPEHMRPALAAIDAVSARFPAIPQFASFDTAFHATLPDAAAGYALPTEWSERFGLRRFGFHGLSVAYAVERAAKLLGDLPARTVVCHLGSGCSVTAVANGRSVDTSMGFSSLEGLMMATRSGSVDPGLLLHLQERCGVGTAELRETLTRRSGLFGVSGVSGDLREVLEAAERGSERAALAYERFTLSVRRALGSATAVLGGMDALVFTGGIGENSSRVRSDATRTFEFLGLRLDATANASGGDDREISVPSSPVKVLVVRAREDLVIARDVLRLLA